MTLLGKNIGLWKLAEVYLWSTCATATGAIDDGSALQAHGWFESTDRTATLESLSACAQRPATRLPLVGDISLAREGIVS